MSVGVRTSGNECEWYNEKQELLLVGMVKCQRRLLGGFVWDVCGWGLALGRPRVGARCGLEAPKHSGLLFAEVTGLLGQTGIWQERNWCIGLEKMNSSQLSLALVVEENHGQLCERQSEQVTCFRFSNPQILRD